MTTKRLPEVWGAAEIARHLAVSRQRVQQLVLNRKTTGFPAPAATLDMGKIWLADDVRAWAKTYTPKHRTGPKG